jgi:hypothetical protein
MAQIEAIEEAWDLDHLAESDKAWDAIHRCLTDGQLDAGGGTGRVQCQHCGADRSGRVVRR